MDYSILQTNISAIAADFAAHRSQRQSRRYLDRVDFERLRAAGLLMVGVPRTDGGLWESIQQTVRPLSQVLRTLAGGDSSVALVSSMHPAVLSYWLTAPATLGQGKSEADRLWQEQCREIYQSVQDGNWWGTITSEPGSGGDVTRSNTTAARADSPTSYSITGQKHFGSGSGIMSFMVTTAVPEGEDRPEWFYVDMRDVSWDAAGSVESASAGRGVRMIAEWDGHGMIATQSHGLAFENFSATRMAWFGSLLNVAKNAGGFIGCLFTSVIVGIVDEAVAAAQRQLASKELGAFERIEWTRVQMEHWLIQQALEGMIRAVETETDPRLEVLQGKTAIAELAENSLTRLCRILGGTTLSRRSPFGFWLADVRALGFLRPPWPLAYKSLEDLADCQV